jgi:NADH:ubiquinone oxidoreductase subunit C
MDNLGLTQRILEIVPNAESVENKQYLTFNVPQNKLHFLAERLKNDEDTKFDYLFCLTGMDYGDSLGVVYHLESTIYKHVVVLKVKTPNRENPVLDTVSDIWKTADFLEREVYDLLGINFKNHPDMRRIFLEENFPGHPLRKDFVDEVNIIER